MKKILLLLAFIYTPYSYSGDAIECYPGICSLNSCLLDRSCRVECSCKEDKTKNFISFGYLEHFYSDRWEN